MLFRSLKGQYPESGFDTITADDGYMMITCVGQFNDQRRPDGDETPSYQFNRLILGMKLLEEP